MGNIEIVERHLYAPGSVTEMTELFSNPRAVSALAVHLRPVLDPEFEVVRSDHGLWGGIDGRIGGLDDWLALYVEQMAEFRFFRVIIDELAELEGDRVLALAACEVCTRTTEVELRQTTGAIVTLRLGRFLRLQEFNNRPEALEAAGVTATG